MRTSIIAASTILVAVVAAKPHAHQHQHQNLHEKREVVWTTAVEVVTETIPITTTIWVDADEVATTTTSSDNAGQFYETTSAVVVQTSSSTSSTPKSSSTHAPAAKPASVAVAPKVASYAPQPLTTSTPAPAVVVSTASSVAPVVSSVAPVPYVAPVSSAAPAVSSTAPAAEASAATSGYSGVCGPGSPCSGDITYYEAGLGACGDYSNGNTTRVIALPVGMMGAQSNGNPFCGMTVTINRNGKSTVATVVDKCMGCVGNSIDLSNLAFEDLADFALGRTQATWHFN